MSVQTALFDESVGVEFSSDLFCKFLRCSRCGCYVFRVDNKMGLYIGDLIPYTYLAGKLVCMECYRLVVGVD